jgi:hypothetical protein
MWFFGSIIVGLLLTYDVVMRGLVLYNFWAWFLLPVFPEAPELAYGQAVGLMLIVSLFKTTTVIDEKDNKKYLILSMLSPIVSLILGGIIHSIIY